MAGCAVVLLGLILAAAPPAPREAAPEPEAPSAEMLLYLAEFVDAEGKGVDPTELPDATVTPPTERRADNAPRKSRDEPKPDHH